jgi:hypothetical protein
MRVERPQNKTKQKKEQAAYALCHDSESSECKVSGHDRRRRRRCGGDDGGHIDSASCYCSSGGTHHHIKYPDKDVKRYEGRSDLGTDPAARPFSWADHTAHVTMAT